MLTGYGSSAYLIRMKGAVSAVGCGLHDTQDEGYLLPPKAKKSSVPDIAGNGDEQIFEGFDDLLDAGRVNADGKPLAWVHVRFQYKGTPLTSSFLSSGGGLNTIVFSGEVDLAVSGSQASTVVSLGSELTQQEEDVTMNPKEEASSRQAHVAVALPDGPDEDGVVTIDPSIMMLGLLNVGALCSSGAICEVHGGFGYMSLAQLLKKGEGLIDLKFGRWNALQNVISLTGAEIHESSRLESKRLKWKIGKTLHAPPDISAAGPNALAASFVDMVKEVSQKRAEKLVYRSLPGLSKIHAAVPISGFTTVESMLHTPTGLTADNLEGLLQATLSIALQQDPVEIEAMREECSKPPSLGTASRWRTIAARSIHLAIRLATDYRADGAVDLDELNQLVFRPIESWLPHADRDFFRESNDCDGSALLALRIGRQIGLSPFGDDRYRASDGSFISLDAGYDEKKHWATTSVRNALSHSDTLVFTIVGASTGEGTKTLDHDQNTPPSVAGHAVALFLPTASLLKALSEGDYERSEEDRAAISSVRDQVFFSAGKILHAASKEETDALRATQQEGHEEIAKAIREIRQAHLEGVRQQRLQPMAIDGTVTSELDLHASGDAGKVRQQRAKETLAAINKFGPTVADKVVDLTALGGSHGPHPIHAFYKDFVEAVIAGPIGSHPELIKLKAAAHNHVFANLQAIRARDALVQTLGQDSKSPSSEQEITMRIGARASVVHNGDMALIPLAIIDERRDVMHRALRSMTRLHSMPPRRPGVQKRTGAEIATAQHNTDALFALGERLEQRSQNESASQKPTVFVEFLISDKVMSHNKKGVQQLIERCDQVAVKGQVDIIDMDSVVQGAVCAVVAFEM